MHSPRNLSRLRFLVYLPFSLSNLLPQIGRNYVKAAHDDLCTSNPSTLDLQPRFRGLGSICLEKMAVQNGVIIPHRS